MICKDCTSSLPQFINRYQEFLVRQSEQPSGTHSHSDFESIFLEDPISDLAIGSKQDSLQQINSNQLEAIFTAKYLRVKIPP